MRITGRHWLGGILALTVIGAAVIATVRLVDRTARDDGLAPGAVAFIETPAGNPGGPLQRADGRWIVAYADGFEVNYGIGFRNPLPRPLILRGIEFQPDPNLFASYGFSAFFKLPFPPGVIVKIRRSHPVKRGWLR